MKIKVCPVCNSKDISTDQTYKFEHRAGLFRFTCHNCDYIGPMTTMEKEIANKLKVKKLIKNLI